MGADDTVDQLLSRETENGPAAPAVAHCTNLLKAVGTEFFSACEDFWFADLTTIALLETFDIQFVEFACFEEAYIEYFSAEEVRYIDCDVCLECIALGSVQCSEDGDLSRYF